MASIAKQVAIFRWKDKNVTSQNKPTEQVTTKALIDIVIAAAGEHKAQDPVHLDLTGRSSITDHYFIVSGENPRQMEAIADKVIFRAREHGYRPLGTEGVGSPHWTLVDLGSVVVHIFAAETRAIYNLEALWPEVSRALAEQREGLK